MSPAGQAGLFFKDVTNHERVARDPGRFHPTGISHGRLVWVTGPRAGLADRLPLAWPTGLRAGPSPDPRTLDAVIVLAMDTATPAVTAGVVRLDPAAPGARLRPLSARVTVDARAHGELLTPHVRDVLAEAGVTVDEVEAVVCGTGPGPFTGLRVGMVTAAAFGHALGRPVYGVSTLDAIAADVDGAAVVGPLLVVTDARRREVYWAAYDADGHRTAGPDVLAPAALAQRLPDLGVVAAAGQGAALYAEVLGLPVVEPAYPSPAGLVSVVAADVLAGVDPAPFLPLYLRRPDAVEPGARKKVTA